LPTGEFQANAVIKHDSAVNAALAAFYSQQQAKLRETAKAEREAEEFAVQADKAVMQAQKKQAKAIQQKAIVEAEKDVEQKQAAVASQLAVLFETQLA